MTRATVWLTGFLIYLLALVASAPASLLDAVLRGYSTDHLRLVEAQGTLWSGSGLIELHSADGSAIQARPVAWQFAAPRLLQARLAWQISLDASHGPGFVALTRSGVELDNLAFHLPAAALSQSMPALSSYGLTGMLSLQVASLVLSSKHASGAALLQWHGAGTALLPVAPLGDYQLQFGSVDGAPIDTALLTTLQGPLLLQGQAGFAAGQPPLVSATARMPAAEHRQLAPFFRLIGIEQDDSSFILQVIAGQLPAL